MSIPKKLTCSILSIGLGLMFIAGCGQPTGGISGTLAYKGKPITAGSLSFQMPSKGIAQDAKMTPEGSFKLEVPLPTGTYEVFYVPPTPEPQDPTKPAAPRITTEVPKKYHDLQTSGLSFEIKSGKNDLSINLDS